VKEILQSPVFQQEAGLCFFSSTNFPPFQGPFGNHSRKEGIMYRRLAWIVLLLTLIVFALGCGSGGGSSGGSSGTTSGAVGTWNLVSSTGGPWPTQITFNADGTGTASPSAAFGAFTWTQQGNQITIKMGSSVVIINSVPAAATSITLTLTSGATGTSTYSRA
jgi:hypothetical protein